MSVVVDSEYGGSMGNSLSIEQDYALWVLLVQTGETIYRARRKELRAYGISTMQAAVLTVIQAIGHKATPAEISRWIFRESHTVSGLLKRMEAEGLVRMTKDLDWKNMIRVTLTDKGQQAYEMSRKRESIRRIFSILSKDQRRQLEEYLRALLSEALVEPPKLALFSIYSTIGLCSYSISLSNPYASSSRSAICLRIVDTSFLSWRNAALYRMIICSPS